MQPPADRPVSETVVEVRSYELDSFDHANHAVFLNYLEHARFQAFERVGYPYREVLARGMGIYVVRVEVDFLREARMGDRLVIHTWADRYKRSSMVIAQRMVTEQDPSLEVVRARVTAVWVGADGRPVRVPDEVRRALRGDESPQAGA